MERVSHTACCLNYGEEHAQLLVTGGVDNNDNTLKDAWILDANTGRWVKVSADVHTNTRLRKSAVEINSEFTSLVCYVDSPQLM